MPFSHMHNKVHGPSPDRKFLLHRAPVAYLHTIMTHCFVELSFCNSWSVGDHVYTLHLRARLGFLKEKEVLCSRLSHEYPGCLLLLFLR